MLGEHATLKNVVEQILNRELPESAFIGVINQTDWDHASADDFKTAIDSSITLGLPFLARRLSEQGVQKYPDDSTLKKLAYLLAPPVVKKSNRPPRPKHGLSTRWYGANAHRYRGQWIALTGDTLLAAAPTREELLANDAVDTTDPDLIVTQVV